MPTMSHTKKQRKAWHAGKQLPSEGKQAWFKRVMINSKNFSGAFTPSVLKRCIVYSGK